MIPGGGLLATIAVQFTMMALLSFGGANAVLPEMHRQAVELRGWVTEQQFADMFAISQVVPGPNVMIVTLIGFKLAGLLGATVGTLAMCGPTAVVAYVLGRAWDRVQGARWRTVVAAGLVPVSVGLVAASAIVLTISTSINLWAVGLVLTTAAITCFTRLSPLWPIAVGAALGATGVIHA